MHLKVLQAELIINVRICTVSALRCYIWCTCSIFLWGLEWCFSLPFPWLVVQRICMHLCTLLYYYYVLKVVVLWCFSIDSVIAKVES